MVGRRSRFGAPRKEAAGAWIEVWSQEVISGVEVDGDRRKEEGAGQG